MGRDKYHPYQTLGDVIWLALTDKKDSPPVNQKRKVTGKESEEEEEDPKDRKRIEKT